MGIDGNGDGVDILGVIFGLFFDVLGYFLIFLCFIELMLRLAISVVGVRLCLEYLFVGILEVEVGRG